MCGVPRRGDGCVQLGDDVADLLDGPDGDDLRRWSTSTGQRFLYAGWEERGNTTAALIAAFTGRRTEQKLIIKYVPLGRRETLESARHSEAWDESPDEFRKGHLVRQTREPIML